MLEALEFLHSKDVMVVHRDITPQNILYTKLDNFVLAGFSLARFGIPEPATYGGTLRYLAPEVYEGLDETAAADVWSLGVLSLDILWLAGPIYEESGFDWARERARFANLCHIAKEANRPEIAMMVVMKPHERSTAAAVLRFVRDSLSAEVQNYRPSMSLLLLLLHARRTMHAVQSSQTSTRAGRTGTTHSESSPQVGSASGTEERAGPSNTELSVRQASALMNEEHVRLLLPQAIQRRFEEGLGTDEWKELLRVLSVGIQEIITPHNDPSHPSDLEYQRSPRPADAQNERQERTTQASAPPDAPPFRPAVPPNLRGESRAERTPSQPLPRHEAPGQPKQVQSQRPPSELPHGPLAQDQQRQARAKESASEPSHSVAASSQQGKNQPEQAPHKPARRPQAGGQPGKAKAEKPRSPSPDRHKSTNQQEEARGKAGSSSPSSSSEKTKPGAKSQLRR